MTYGIVIKQHPKHYFSGVWAEPGTPFQCSRRGAGLSEPQNIRAVATVRSGPVKLQNIRVVATYGVPIALVH